MKPSAFANISTGIVPDEDRYKVCIKVYNNVYYLEPVETEEQAANILLSLDWVLLRTHQEHFFIKYRESNRQHVTMLLTMFGAIVLGNIIGLIPFIRIDIRQMIALILFVLALLPPAIRLWQLRKPPPIIPDDSVIKAMNGSK